jgi:Rod binding domain-containing protein
MNSAAADLGLSLAKLGDAQIAQVQAALKGSNDTKAKAAAAAGNFEAMFLNSMFQEMFTGIDGDGPFGGSGALRVWRSLLTDEYAKSFAKAGGLGIASHVYDTLLKLQGAKAS